MKHILALLCALSLAACASHAPRSADAPAPDVVRSPLDPLTASEISEAARLVRAKPEFPKEAAFAAIVLAEPGKEAVRAAKPGAAIERWAFAVIADTPHNRTFEALVNLSGRQVTSWTEVKGAQTQVLFGEYPRYSAIVRADPGFRAALAKRGITDPASVVIEGWAGGQNLPGDGKKARYMRGLCYMKADGPNYYGRPIEGLIALVDMNQGKVVDLMDDVSAPVPPKSQQLDAKSVGVPRAVKPLTIAQPQGADFRVEGNVVTWQRWRFHVSMHPREGLVLRDVGYEDGGRVRPILWRASVSEMAVPYGDPSRSWAWRNAFDEGEYGLGKLSVAVDRDLPTNGVALDAVFADDAGEPSVAPKRIGIYERDGGVLWRHSSDAGSDVRRSRELVVFFVATIGNYDYSISWIFRQDGSIEADAAASGIMLPKAVASGGHGGHGEHVVDVGTAAPHHQHFFNYRLDFDVDGASNSISELDAFPAPVGKNNPYLNAMQMADRPLATELAARRDVAPERGRKWRVFNPDVKNELGANSAFLLIPGENGLPLTRPGSAARRRAAFAEHQFWATRYDPAQLYAAGSYPNQALGGDGLPKWTAEDQSLVKQDVVVWYTFGLTHVPRAEEWPVMPAAHIGFKLLPAGFFAKNPALDLPEETGR